MNIVELPALIDPHVHFRTPGAEYKEDWITGAKSAIHGGVTTVFDMPNTNPATTTYQRILEKKSLIDAQLKRADIPLHYRLFFGADKNQFDELSKLKSHPDLNHIICGVKVFMGSSTGDLLMDDLESLDKLFKLCAKMNLLLAVHAEKESMIQENSLTLKSEDFACHSIIRSPEVAAKALSEAIALTRKYGTTLYALHIGSKLELELLYAAKQEGLPIFIEIAPHFLFLDTNAYEDLQGMAKMNPPLRLASDREFLWKAIELNWIDTIGSDHAPHLLHEKMQPYCQCPSGVPGIQTTLPLLLNAYHQGKITLENIIALTHTNPKRIFNLPEYNDKVIVDLDLEKIVTKDRLYSKAGWSPYEGMHLKGWPIETIIGERRYELSSA